MKVKKIKDTEKREIMIEVNNFIDKSTFEGRLDDVINNIQQLPGKLISYYPLNNEFKNCHRFSIKQDTEYEYGDNGSHDVYHLQCWRWETDEEVTKRIEKSKKASDSAKKAAITKQLAKEKREKTLYENLKKKFENG